MGVPTPARRARLTFGALLAVPTLLLGGCTVSPPPAPQSTETTETTPPPPPKAPTQIIMAIDSIGPGFNPHLLSDQSPVNAAIASLVLPSSFRPVPDPTSPTGSRWELDTTLLESAEVTNENPFTVTYKIRPEAQWTDNAPIAADDYWYLWRQMVSQPGVVDPAGYDLITGVQSVEGGKQAVVTFSQPYPAWRELFNDILPAHIVKDIPGGFGAGLARAMPVTGGQFRVETIDPQRDEILLARNDRFWSVPAKPDLVLFRRGGAPAALADSIRNGDTQVAQVHGGAATFAQLSAIPRRPDRTHRDPARHAAHAAGAAAQACRSPSAQGDPGSDRRRPPGIGGRRRRQHRDTRAGAGAFAVGSRLRADRAACDDA